MCAAAGVFGSVNVQLTAKSAIESARLPPVAGSESNTGITLIKQAGRARCPILSLHLKTATHQPTNQTNNAAWLQGGHKALGYQGNNEELPLPSPVRLSEKGFWWQEFKIHIKRCKLKIVSTVKSAKVLLRQ